MSAFDVDRTRAEFPGLEQSIRGKKLVYLDNAATSQKPNAVLEAVGRAYRDDCANIHRGVHTLSARATEAFEAVRGRAQRFLGAADSREIVFTSGTTESVNLVAQSYGSRLRAGDAILLTELEHHSNIVPWQLLAEQRGLAIKVLPIDDQGELRLERLDELLTPEVRLVSLTHASNALGTVNPLEEVIERAHRVGAVVFVDGAQAAPHLPIDVRRLGCDFYAFSGHKVFGPTGTGVLFGRLELLESMPPWKGGGDMIRRVTFERTTFAAPPQRFEAGTPHIAGVLGLGAALDFVSHLDRDGFMRHEERLLKRADEGLSKIPGLQVVGKARFKVPVLSFTIKGVHPQDLGTLLDQQGVAVRTGHHCAEPLMHRLGVSGTTRASFALYNTEAEVDVLVEAVERARKLLD